MLSFFFFFFNSGKKNIDESKGLRIVSNQLFNTSIYSRVVNPHWGLLSGEHLPIANKTSDFIKVQKNKRNIQLCPTEQETGLPSTQKR